MMRTWHISVIRPGAFSYTLQETLEALEKDDWSVFSIVPKPDDSIWIVSYKD